MSELETLPAETIPDVDEITETGEPMVAHIVKVAPGESAAAKVLEARINGTPVEALCGHVWVPARDPKQLPVCPGRPLPSSRDAVTRMFWNCTSSVRALACAA